jgi:hypothetical protein
MSVRTTEKFQVVCKLGIFLALICLFISPVFGQEKSSEINGIVTDETGGILPGVTVKVINSATGRTLTLLTSEQGSYNARPLDPGRYSIKFEFPGFAPAEFTGVNVLLGQTLKLDAKLRVGGVETSVQVSEAAPLIDTQSTLVAHNVTAEEFDRLPKSRTFQYFALTAPSVNSGEIEGGIQVNGASGAENNFTVDGISTNSIIYGSSRQNAAFEYLQEVQIKTTGIEAQYGGALGGVISAVTKSGGNQFHGNIFTYYSGSAISAAPVKRLVLDPRDDKTVSYVQDNKDPRHTTEAGFTLGGPFVKDKVFFFAAFTPQWVRQTRNTGWTYGTDKDSYQKKERYMNAFGKVSWDPISKVRTNFSYLWTPVSSTGVFLGYNGPCASCDSRTLASTQTLKTQGFFQPQSNYAGSVDFIASNNLLVQARGTYRWDNYKDTGIPNVPGITYRTSSIGLAGVPANLQGGVGFTNTPQVSQTFYDLTTTAIGQLDVSYTGKFAGLHNIKAGTGVMKFVNSVNRSRNGGVYIDVYWDRDFASLVPGVGTGRGAYGYYEVNALGTIGSTGAGIKNIYFQDQWRVTNRLTLNLGLRMEQERIPSFRRDIKDYAVEFGWGDKLAPRLGASYDLLGDGKVKLSGSWGRLYDWTKYELVRGSFGGDIWKIQYRALDNPADVFNLSKTNTPGRSLWNPADPTALRDRRVPSFDTVPAGLEPMHQDNFNVGIEYELNPRTVLGARYLHDDLRETIEDLGALDAGGNEVYLLANPGRGAGKVGAPATATTAFNWPRPKRQYDALELTATRRFSRGWSGQASYVLSRLYGNYAGLSNSDEIRTPTTGRSSATAQQSSGSIARPGSNVTRGWDLDEIVFDSHGNLDVLGRLATDRPHVFKLNSQYEFSMLGGSTNVGGFLYVGSGTPISTQAWTRNQIPVMVNGRGDLGRSPVLSSTDLMVSHTLNVKEGHRLRFEFNVLNAFNQKTARNIFPYVNRGANAADSASAISLANVNLKDGYDYNALIAATANGAVKALDPRFGKEDLFNSGLSGRFGVKYIF